MEEETILPFPEQSISQSDKSLCYIYPTKAADDILTAARCRRTAHAPANQTAGRGEGEQDMYQAEESTETFVLGEDNIYTVWKEIITLCSADSYSPCSTNNQRHTTIKMNTTLKKSTNKMILKQMTVS